MEHMSGAGLHRKQSAVLTSESVLAFPLKDCVTLGNFLTVSVVHSFSNYETGVRIVCYSETKIRHI